MMTRQCRRKIGMERSDRVRTKKGKGNTKSSEKKGKWEEEGVRALLQ